MWVSSFLFFVVKFLFSRNYDAKMLHNDLIPDEGAGRILTEAALIIPAICGWDEVKQTGHN